MSQADPYKVSLKFWIGKANRLVVTQVAAGPQFTARLAWRY